MCSKFWFTLFSCCIFCVLSVEDVYWRSYGGDIPGDALTAGINFGYNVYIGRAPLETHGTFVGPIIPGIDYIVVGYGDDIYSLDRHVEILCSDNPENFTWVRTTPETLLFNAGLVVGGFYVDEDFGNLYIGRSLFGTELAVGRVDGYHLGQDAHKNMLLITDGVEEYAISDYEVLTYT